LEDVTDGARRNDQQESSADGEQQPGKRYADEGPRQEGVAEGTRRPEQRNPAQAARRRDAFDADLPIAEFDDHAVALVPDPPPDLADQLRELLSGMTAGLGRERLAIGIGSRRTAGLRATVDEARHALRIGRARSDQVSVTGHEELASHVLLLSGLPEDVRVAYRDRLLGPLRAYDRLHRSDLETTLETFLACSTSWTRCAEQMHVHVNTLRYRIARIEELTGRSLADLETQVDLFLALRLRQG
jgi:sugar diacid utilization regulator